VDAAGGVLLQNNLRGQVRLAGNQTVTAAVDAIDIAAPLITIDPNGFAITESRQSPTPMGIQGSQHRAGILDLAIININ
jgi:hypothetical protein